jgi:hypothetical protein
MARRHARQLVRRPADSTAVPFDTPEGCGLSTASHRAGYRLCRSSTCRIRSRTTARCGCSWARIRMHRPGKCSGSRPSCRNTPLPSRFLPKRCRPMRVRRRCRSRRRRKSTHRGPRRCRSPRRSNRVASHLTDRRLSRPSPPSHPAGCPSRLRCCPNTRRPTKAMRIRRVRVVCDPGSCSRVLWPSKRRAVKMHFDAQGVRRYADARHAARRTFLQDAGRDARLARERVRHHPCDGRPHGCGN